MAAAVQRLQQNSVRHGFSVGAAPWRAGGGADVCRQHGVLRKPGLLAAWQGFAARVTRNDDPWLLTQTHQGPAAIEAVYAEVLAGGGDPRVGHIIKFQITDCYIFYSCLRT